MITVIVAVDVEFESAVVKQLSAAPDVEITARPADEYDLLAAAQAGLGEVVILSRHFTGVDSDVVDRIRRSGVKVLGFGEDREHFHAWRITQTVSAWASADQLITALRDCCADVDAPPKPQAPPPLTHTGAQAPIIAVWGTGSAPGRSTVANAVAHSVSQAVETILVDADTVSAAQASLLGLLNDAPHIAALCRAASTGALHPQVIDVHSTRIAPHLRIVTGLSRAERWPEIRPTVLTDVLEVLAQNSGCVIVDVSDRVDPDDDLADPYYDRHGATRAVLDRADHTVIVGSADPLGLQRLIALLGTERAGALRDSSTLVVNRVRAAAVGSNPEARIRSTLERFAGVRDAVLLPDARQELDAAVLAGRIITEDAPSSRIARALRALSSDLPIPGVRLRSRESRRRRGRMRT